MIELKNVTKIYKGKGGVSVKALDDVSLTLPDRGMVFILGKSGCGKSTMLNILGGLDYPTSGELTVKGRSSKTFRTSDYDSYRNTCVGFIFQEYNVLNDFSVRQNILLAAELRNDREAEKNYENVLESVELGGLSDRKPNTLSGGQKQRVAIARALIKDPEIILADEPTGALDSVTGKAVLDTLRQLSESKLVVVVSHDREFAESYADRIVELSDGRIISDRVRSGEQTVLKNKATVLEDGIHLVGKADESLLEKLNELLKSKSTVTIIREEEGAVVTTGSFRELKDEKITGKTYAAEESRFIRSKFPLRYAIRMGASGLKSKTFRLILTILLTTIALTAFGFMLTLMSFNADKVLEKALDESGLSEIGMAYYRKGTEEIPILGITNEVVEPESMDKNTIDALKAKTGLDYLRVRHMGKNNFYLTFRFNNAYTERNYYYPEEFCGFSDASPEELAKFGVTLKQGAMPKATDEIAISEWMAESLYALKATDPEGAQILNSADESPVGKTIVVADVPLRVCGVFSCPRPDKRYDELKDAAEIMMNYGFVNDKKVTRLSTLSSELEKIYKASLCTVALTNEEFCRVHANDFSHYDKTALIEIKSEDDKQKDDYYGGVDASIYPEVRRIDNVAAEKVFTLDGKEPREGVLYLTDAALYGLVDQLFNAGRLTAQEYDTLVEHLLKCPEAQAREHLTAALKTLRDKLPGAFDDITIYSSISGETVTGSVLGCVYTGRADQYDNWLLYVSKKDYEVLYPDEYDPEGADFLLTPNTAQARRKLTGRQFRKENKEGLCYDLYNNYQEEKTSSYASIVNIFSKVFLWTGIFLALFASLLLFNFISVSINYKKKDIGILRALGARKIDVFKVFFSESMLIISVCFFLSVFFSLILSLWFNSFLKENLMVTASLFFFGPLQALILGALATVVAFISTILPVHHHAKKPPVDAIRSL